MLDVALGRDVAFEDGFLQPKPLPQFPAQAFPVIADDGKARTFFRAVQGEGADDGLPAGNKGGFQGIPVGGAVVFIGQEMKHRPVMP